MVTVMCEKVVEMLIYANMVLVIVYFYTGDTNRVSYFVEKEIHSC